MIDKIYTRFSNSSLITVPHVALDELIFAVDRMTILILFIS